MWEGQLLHIHITSAAGEPMVELPSATLEKGSGIVGDRYALGTGQYSAIPDIREVTLIEQETLEALSRDHDIDLSIHEHRRNLTTCGVPLNHLVGKRFMVGSVVLEGGRLNTPCKYFEMLTKKTSVFEFLKHRSGLNCSIVEGGVIEAGTTIVPL